MKELEQTIKFQVRTGHIRFYNQLWAGTDKAGAYLPYRSFYVVVLQSSCLNSLDTTRSRDWRVAHGHLKLLDVHLRGLARVHHVRHYALYGFPLTAPIYLNASDALVRRMELYILERLRKLSGWSDGDGAFAPGGAHCNLLAMLAARNHTLPRLRKARSISIPCFLYPCLTIVNLERYPGRRSPRRLHVLTVTLHCAPRRHGPRYAAVFLLSHRHIRHRNAERREGPSRQVWPHDPPRARRRDREGEEGGPGPLLH